MLTEACEASPALLAVLVELWLFDSVGAGITSDQGQLGH